MASLKDKISNYIKAKVAKVKYDFNPGVQGSAANKFWSGKGGETLENVNKVNPWRNMMPIQQQVNSIKNPDVLKYSQAALIPLLHDYTASLPQTTTDKLNQPINISKNVPTWAVPFKAGAVATDFALNMVKGALVGDPDTYRISKPAFRKLLDGEKFANLTPEEQQAIQKANSYNSLNYVGMAEGLIPKGKLKVKGQIQKSAQQGRQSVPLSSAQQTPLPQSKISPEVGRQSKRSAKLADQNSFTNNIPQDVKLRGFTESVQDATTVSSKAKSGVDGSYNVKHNKQLMGEAQALLTEGASIDFKNVKNLDQKITATIQEAINLDKAGNHAEAAALYNNLAENATELGRSVQALSLLDKMSPEAISLSAAGKIKKYNLTATRKIPELNAEQAKMISDSVTQIRNMPPGRERNIAINELNIRINEFIPSSLTDKIITTWKAGLLTSLRTHERNLVGNTMMTGAEILKDPFASLADIAMSKRTGIRTQTSTLQGLSELGSANTRQQVSDLVVRGYDPTQEISKFEIKKVNWGKNPVEQALKTYTDSVFRVLSAEDRPFYNAAFARSMYDQAGAAAKNAGKSGDTAFIKNLVDNPTEQVLTTATTDANYATFHDKNIVSKYASSIKRVAGDNWTKLPAEVVMPFTGVPSSIAGKTIAYSPIGLVKGAAKFGKVVVKNVPDLQRQAAQEIGRGTVGTGLFGLGAYLMSKGLMTGQPKDATEAEQWKLEGKQANSVMVNGKWRSINSVGPQTLVILAGAKYQEEMDSLEGSFGKYAAGLGKDQLSQTFLQGMLGPLNAISDPNRYGTSYVGNTLSSAVPNIVKDVSKATDSTARETNTIPDYFKAGVPGLRNTLLPRRDVLGNVIPQEPTKIAAFIDLFNSKTPISNTVVNELARLNNEGTNATPSKLQKTQTINGVKMKLTPQELNNLEAQVGPQLTTALERLFRTEEYQAQSDAMKAKAVDNLVADIRKRVKAQAGSIGMPDTGYVSSKDAPKTLTDKLSVYGNSALTDPGKTINAILSGQPIRKVVGDSVILERQNDLAVLDNGNKTTVVDHIVPLSLGGTNDKSNLQTLTTNENKAKAKVEGVILRELKAGKITEKEAQARVLKWRDQIDVLPEADKQDILADLASGGGRTYQIISESGSVRDVDIDSPLRPPSLTGQDLLDKEIMSDYKSSINKRIKDIKDVYKNGDITAEEANKLLSQYTKLKERVANLTKKPKKLSIRRGTVPKIKSSKPKTATLKAFKPSGKAKFNVKTVQPTNYKVSKADLDKLRTGNV